MGELTVVEDLALPVLWDGWRIEWRIQDRPTQAFKISICPPPKKPATCTACKSTRGWVAWVGTRHPKPGEMFDSSVRKTGRFGRPIEVPRKVPAWPVHDLVAFRCLDCAADEVWDMRTNEMWDLEPNDYGSEGSTRPEVHSSGATNPMTERNE